MKKKIITIIVVSFLSVVFLSAKEKALPMPAKGSVTLVGRINFSSNIDRDFLFESAGIPEDKRNYPDICFMPFFTDKVELRLKEDVLPEDPFEIMKYFEQQEKENKKKKISSADIKNFEAQAMAVNGEYFFIQYKFNSDRKICLRDATIFIGGSPHLPVILPINSIITVPEGESFLYIGDYFFDVKDFSFTVSKKVVDNFDDAAIALNKAVQKEVALSRAIMEKYIPEEHGKIWYMMVPPSVNIDSWYDRYKNLNLSVK